MYFVLNGKWKTWKKNLYFKADITYGIYKPISYGDIVDSHISSRVIEFWLRARKSFTHYLGYLPQSF